MVELWHCSRLLHIMLIAVDLLVMDILVVCFIFLLMELLIIIIGIVVLLYHLNYTHYTFRGGNSRNGAACGIFYVLGNVGDGGTGWYYGAALSLEYTLYSSRW